MAETLTDFIIRRRAEIDLEETPLQERLAALRAEKTQLAKAAIAAGLEAKPDSGQEGPRRGRPPKVRRPQEGTIKTHVIAILKEGGSGMTAGQILEKLRIQTGSTLLRSSLSPQLSRLKQEGYLELTGTHWHLPDQKIETSDNNLFNEELSEVSKPDYEAQDGKAPSGSGTS